MHGMQASERQMAHDKGKNEQATTEAKGSKVADRPIPSARVRSARAIDSRREGSIVDDLLWTANQRKTSLAQEGTKHHLLPRGARADSLFFCLDITCEHGHSRARVH